MILITYVPYTKLGVIDDEMSHGKLHLVLRWIYRLNLPNNTTLRPQNLPVFLRNIRQDSNYERVCSLDLSQTLSQSNNPFNIVSIPSL